MEQQQKYEAIIHQINSVRSCCKELQIVYKNRKREMNTAKWNELLVQMKVGLKELSELSLQVPNWTLPDQLVESLDRLESVDQYLDKVKQQVNSLYEKELRQRQSFEKFWSVLVQYQ